VYAAYASAAALAANKVKIAEAGGIAAIVAAMGSHVGVSGVQEQGCWAFASLAVNDGTAWCQYWSCVACQMCVMMRMRDWALADGTMPCIGGVGAACP